MATDPTTSLPPTELSEIGYRPFSVTAALAIVLAVAGGLAFTSNYLIWIPWAAIACALVALRSIHNAGGELAGRKVALLALFLGALLATASTTRSLTRVWWLEARAQRAGEHWFDLLSEGRLYEAYQLTVEPSLRLPASTDFEAVFAANPESQKGFDKFRSHDIVASLLKASAPIRHEYLRTTIESVDDADSLYLRSCYRLTLPRQDPDTPAERSVDLIFLRTINLQGAEEWRLVSFLQHDDEHPDE